MRGLDHIGARHPKRFVGWGSTTAMPNARFVEGAI
jgi:hypothetical protein